MYRLLVEKQRRRLPYYLCTGLALGLSHEKTIWEKQRSREWWTDIVKGTFSDDQWMENFRMTKATFEILCDDLRPSFPDLARSVREPLQLPLRCTGWPLPPNTVLLPICLVLENQQYLNASMMSAQQ